MNRGEASDAILTSRASTVQKLILLEYFRRQDSRADPVTATSWPGLASCAETAGCNEDTARFWRTLLIEAGVLVVADARKGRTSAMRIDYGALATYQPPKKANQPVRRAGRGPRSQGGASPDPDPSRKSPLVKITTGENHPLPEITSTPLVEITSTPLVEITTRSLLIDLSSENSPQATGGQAPLLEPSAPPLSPEVGRLIVLLQRWATEPLVKARWKVDLDADVRWFLARVVPGATKNRVDLLAELDAIDNWCEGKHRSSGKPGWTAGGWKNGIARWLGKPNTQKLPSPEGTPQAQNDPAAAAAAWDRLVAEMPAQGPACIRGAPARVLAAVDAVGGMDRLCRLNTFDLSRQRPAFLAAFTRHVPEQRHAAVPFAEPSDRTPALDRSG